uniref:RING finger protein 208 n=1 Tax=Monodelphis domestica TaxID=13616 RepID=F6SDY7_MONDO
SGEETRSSKGGGCGGGEEGPAGRAGGGVKSGARGPGEALQPRGASEGDARRGAHSLRSPRLRRRARSAPHAPAAAAVAAAAAAPSPAEPAAPRPPPAPPPRARAPASFRCIPASGPCSSFSLSLLRSSCWSAQCRENLLGPSLEAGGASPVSAFQITSAEARPGRQGLGPHRNRGGLSQACSGDVPALEGVPRTPPPPRRPRKSSGELGFPRVAPGDEVIVNQYVLRPGPAGEPLECPTCGHTYNLTQRRPRVLSCLHSVCEQCLQILYESCPKYKFISCPTCRRETVLFTDYGLAALAVNTSILSRLPPEALTAPPGQWGGEAEGSCYQTFRQYCGAACTCHVRNPLSSCAIM